jgi:hypothetical protein
VAAELRSVAAIIDTRTEAAEAAAATQPLRHSSKRGLGAGILIALLLLAAIAGAWFVLKAG